MADVGVERNGVVDRVLEEPRVREIEAFVDADREDAGGRVDLMPVDVAVVLGAGDAADDGDVRARGAAKEQRERGQDADGDADFDAEGEGAEDRARHRGEVGLGIGPGAPDRVHVDERKHGHDDRRGKRRLWQEEQKRRQENGGERDADGGQGACGGRARAGVEVDDRAREAARHWEAA